MAEQPVCPRQGRPAVASRVRVRPDGTQVEYLCEIDLAEEQMSGRFGRRGGSLFDDFFSDFFGDTARAPKVAHSDQRHRSVKWNGLTSRSSSAMQRKSCCSVPRRRRSSGAASASTATTSSMQLCRTTSYVTCSARPTPIRRRSQPRSTRRRRRLRARRLSLALQGREGCASGGLRRVA